MSRRPQNPRVHSNHRPPETQIQHPTPTVEVNTNHASVLCELAKLSKYIPNTDLHRMSATLHRASATNIYRYTDSACFRLHGSGNPEPTLDSVSLPYEMVAASPEESWKSYFEKLATTTSADMKHRADSYRQTGQEDNEAVPPVFPNSDYMAGIAGVCAVLIAPMWRAEAGGSYKVDTALNYSNAWLARSVGEYPSEVWADVWARHGKPVFRAWHNMAYMDPRVLGGMVKSGVGKEMFEEWNFEERERE